MLMSIWSDKYSIKSLLTCFSPMNHPREKGDIPIEGVPSAQSNEYLLEWIPLLCKDQEAKKGWNKITYSSRY